MKLKYQMRAMVFNSLVGFFTLFHVTLSVSSAHNFIYARAIVAVCFALLCFVLCCITDDQVLFMKKKWV